MHFDHYFVTNQEMCSVMTLVVKIVFTIITFFTRLDSVLISCSEAIDDPALTFTPAVVDEDGGSDQVSGGTELMSQEHVALISPDGTQQVGTV